MGLGSTRCRRISYFSGAEFGSLCIMAFNIALKVETPPVDWLEEIQHNNALSLGATVLIFVIEVDSNHKGSCSMKTFPFMAFEFGVGVPEHCQW